MRFRWGWGGAIEPGCWAYHYPRSCPPDSVERASSPASSVDCAVMTSPSRVKCRTLPHLPIFLCCFYSCTYSSNVADDLSGYCQFTLCLPLFLFACFHPTSWHRSLAEVPEPMCFWRLFALAYFIIEAVKSDPVHTQCPSILSASSLPCPLNGWSLSIPFLKAARIAYAIHRWCRKRHVGRKPATCYPHVRNPARLADPRSEHSIGR